MTAEFSQSEQMSGNDVNTGRLAGGANQSCNLIGRYVLPWHSIADGTSCLNHIRLLPKAIETTPTNDLLRAGHGALIVGWDSFSCDDRFIDNI